jgi:hypothetical protein
MRDHQPDEADDTGHGNENGGRQGGDEECRAAHPRHRNAEALGGAFAGEEGIETAVVPQAVGEDDAGAKRREADIVPAGESEPTHGPEQHRVRGALVAGEDEIVGQGGEQEGDGEAGKD